MVCTDVLRLKFLTSALILLDALICISLVDSGMYSDPQGWLRQLCWLTRLKHVASASWHSDFMQGPGTACNWASNSSVGGWFNLRKGAGKDIQSLDNSHQRHLTTFSLP